MHARQNEIRGMRWSPSQGSRRLAQHIAFTLDDEIETDVEAVWLVECNGGLRIFAAAVLREGTDGVMRQRAAEDCG